MNNKKKLSSKVIERWLKDSDWRVRKAAMLACQGKDVPIEIIERGLKDSDWCVRKAAMQIAKKRGHSVDVLERTIEPPEKVYKKCLFEAIVTATIPADAKIRGTIGGKCRASKAVIVDIECSVYPEKIAISSYDNSVFYEIGEEVIIEDFDYSNEECSTGFHFFCSREEAERY